MLRGSCLCQGVAFEIDGRVIDLLYCHCSMCRKAHGSAFRARGKVKASEFRWTRGEALVRYFESSPGTHRGFCSVCGANLVSRFDHQPKVLGLALGALDDDPVNRPICHVHVASKAPWHEITDALPQFDELPAAPVLPPERSRWISRQWRGVAKPALADAYVEHLQQETFPALHRLAGFVSAAILRRQVPEGVEFLVVTRWTSIEAIRAFSGADVEAAVVPQKVHDMMVDYDRVVRHYEVVS